MAFSGGIPLPKIVADVGPGGGVTTAVKAANELDKQNIENRIKLIEEQYAPYNKYADALSKVAYAKIAGPQTLATILSSPAAVSRMSPETYNALANLAQKGLTSVGDVNVPTPNQMRAHPSSPLSYAINAIRDLFQGNQPTSKKPMIPSNLPQSMAETTPSTGSQNGAFLNGQSDVSPSSSVVPSSTIGRVAQSFKTPGTYGGINPSSVNQAQTDALKTTATSEAAAQSDLWKKKYETLGERAEGAQNNINLVDKFSEAYDKLGKYERGPNVSKIPAQTAAATDAETTANALADAVARAQQQGHITQADRATYQGMKPGRFMLPESKKHAVNFLKGMNERELEFLPFYTKMQELGLNPQQADVVKNYYINQRPFYNPKAGEINEKNLNTWEDFLEPEKLSEAFSPRLQKKNSHVVDKPDMAKDKETSNKTESVMLGGIKYLYQNGIYYK